MHIRLFADTHFDNAHFIKENKAIMHVQHACSSLNFKKRNKHPPDAYIVDILDGGSPYGYFLQLNSKNNIFWSFFQGKI